LNLKTNNLLIISLLSTFSDVVGVLIYATFINPIQKIYIDESAKAIKTAENNLLFSDKFERYFRSATPTSFIKAARQSQKAVVFIRALSKMVEPDLLTDSYAAETGSGVIVSSDGYIVTNNHVVKGASVVEIMLNDNREYKAQIIGTDENTDLALLKIEIANTDYLIFGNSDSLQVGEWVMAVGNPFRLQSTVTAGIVSAKGRNINILENQGIESFIQTDAAVNPGNSGGALVNTNGELVGINTAIMSQSGNYEGFSFAIPANLAKKVVSDLREYGYVQRGWLGVVLENIDNNRAKKLELPEISGVYISLVTKNGAAYEAGLQSGDVITRLNGKKLESLPKFMENIGIYKPGDKVEIEYYRDGARRKTTAILRNHLNSLDLVVVRKDKVITDLGFELREMDSFEKSRAKSEGIVVASVYKNSVIDNARIEPGFIITKVNNKKVTTVNELIKMITDYKGKLSLNGFYENYPGEFPYVIEIP
jgi:Do/DeqQ family serine protease